MNTVRYRIKANGRLVGGEFYGYSDAARYARQRVGGFWQIVPCDVHGNELSP